MKEEKLCSEQLLVCFIAHIKNIHDSNEYKNLTFDEVIKRAKSRAKRMAIEN